MSQSKVQLVMKLVKQQMKEIKKAKELARAEERALKAESLEAERQRQAGKEKEIK